VPNDNAYVEDPIDPVTPDNVLEHDEREAIDLSTAISRRTRGASKVATYAEPNDEK
ncbi:uncharacterized protein K452DRAFT_198395, partial [Aplosporella prunicola CBS 121167]